MRPKIGLKKKLVFFSKWGSKVAPFAVKTKAEGLFVQYNFAPSRAIFGFFRHFAIFRHFPDQLPEMSQRLPSVAPKVAPFGEKIRGLGHLDQKLAFWGCFAENLL